MASHGHKSLEPVRNRLRAGNAAARAGGRLPLAIPELGKSERIDVLAVAGQHAHPAGPAGKEVQGAFAQCEGHGRAVFR